MMATVSNFMEPCGAVRLYSSEKLLSASTVTCKDVLRALMGQTSGERHRANHNVRHGTDANALSFRKGDGM
jgi:hypothetical protein